MDRRNQKGYRFERGNWEEIQEIGSERIETAREFSVIVDPYIQKRCKNDGELDYFGTCVTPTEKDRMDARCCAASLSNAISFTITW